MSTIKRLQREDVTSARTLLHEEIPVTGSLISGTYGGAVVARGLNIKTYDHGMFQSVYDYPFLSSSANHIFDITYGFREGEHFTTLTTLASGNADKRNIYHQMAQMLYGFDPTASVEPFRISGSYDSSETVVPTPCFLNFARLMGKDEIKKGSFRLSLGMSASHIGYEQPFGYLQHIGDYGATASFNDTNSPAGEFGILRSGSSTGDPSDGATGAAVGIIYYQAGVVMLDLSQSIDLAAAKQTGAPNKDSDGIFFVSSSNTSPQQMTFTGSMESGSIDELADALRHRIHNVSFQNTTELNSTIYFCRAGANEFNFSSNPTYLTSSKIRVKEDNPSNPPISYITTVGLYADDGALVATAKLSEPLKKTTTDELTIRVRLDY
jgi:hypothetical protein